MKPLPVQKKPGVKLFFFIVPLLLCLAYIPFQFKKSLVFFPAGNNGISLEAYLDTTGSERANGTVITRFDTSNSVIDLHYTIGSRNVYPYAGFQWIVQPGNPWIDLTGYDHLTFSLAPETTEDVLILILQFFTEGFSKMDDRMTWRVVSKELPLIKGQSTYTIPLNDLVVPLWWYNQYKTSEKELGPVDYSKLGMLSIEEGSDVAGAPRRICLKSLKFEKKQGLFIAELFLFLLIFYYALILTILQIRKLLNKKSSPVVIPYQKLTIESNQKSEEVKVFEFLGNSFSNPDLSLSFISNEIGIAGSKISTIIKNRYNMSFRQYLNTIRIAEAKRLLQETDLQISQIAYKVGYSNLTHFCRTFKDETQTSPNSYRHDQNETAKAEIVG